jgi:hypothetical protein
MPKWTYMGPYDSVTIDGKTALRTDPESQRRFDLTNERAEQLRHRYQWSEVDPPAAIPQTVTGEEPVQVNRDVRVEQAERVAEASKEELAQPKHAR